MSNFKLNINSVKDIRDDYFLRGLTRDMVSKKYNISIGTISAITTNKIWTIDNVLYLDYINKLLELKSILKLIEIKSKVCSICNIEKDINQFNKIKKDSNKKVAQCKECQVAYKKEYSKNNKEKIKKDKAEYYQENREKEINRAKIWYEENTQQKKDYDKARYPKKFELNKEYRKQYYMDNKQAHIDRARINTNRRYKTDTLFKIRNRASCEIKRALLKVGKTKNGHSILEYLPYSIAELKTHIESQFESWMNWGNWKKYDINTWKDDDQSTWTWNLDHIIPQSKLIYSSMEENNFQICWGLSNLRPYSSKQNIKDGNRRG